MTNDLWAELRKCRRWKISGYGDRASFNAWRTRDDYRAWASVHVRCGKYETIEAMVWRALAELNRRLVEGMPKRNPALVARRKFRDAPSASKFAN